MRRPSRNRSGRSPTTRVPSGRAENDAYGGSSDYELRLETERLGLWPGGFLSVFGESRFGKT